MHEDRSEPDAAPTITTVARLANVSVASASRVLNGIRTNPETLAKGPGSRCGDRLRPQRRRPLAALAPHGPDRVRDARRREPRLHDDGQLDPGGRERGGLPTDAALDRRRRGGRARDAPRPEAALRRRADPLLAPSHGGARRGARQRGRTGRRDRSAADGHSGRHGAGELPQGRGRGGAAPPRGRPPPDRLRERTGGQRPPAARAAAATSTGCGRAASAATRRSARSPPTSRSRPAGTPRRGSSPGRSRTRSSAPTIFWPQAPWPHSARPAGTSRATSRWSGWTTPASRS